MQHLSPKHLAALVVPALALGFAPRLPAQCTTGWTAGPMGPAVPGADGPIHAMIVYAPPGQSSRLIVGGEFSHIGGIEAHNIAAWDGIGWQTLGSGTDGAVHSLAIYNSQLYVGGSFLSPGVRIATWNGLTWASVGPIGDAIPDPEVGIWAMKVFNGELYVGGTFASVNGVGVSSNAARFNGATWSTSVGLPVGVRAMEVIDWDGPAGPTAPTLYIGGLGGIHEGETSLGYTFDGVTFTEIAGPFGSVYSLAVYDGLPPTQSLVVGGSFTDWVLGDGTHILAYGMIRIYDLGGDVITFGAVRRAYAVFALQTYGEDLYVGGVFDADGALATEGMAYIDLSENVWAVPGGGLLGSGQPQVNALCVFNNLLYAGGEFEGADNVPGSVAVRNLAHWSGLSWGAIDQPPNVLAMTAIGSRLVAGGDFSHTTGTLPGTLNRHNMLTWDGAQTGGLGLGANGVVRVLTSYSTSGPSGASMVIAGGDFSVVYGDGLDPGSPVSASRIAQWTEPQLGPAGWSPMGAGLNGTVYALDRFNGEVVAGGSFTASGATGIGRLGRWTGSPASWQPFGAVSLNGTVYAFKTYLSSNLTDQNLVIGGSFTAASGSGVTANRIVQITQTPLGGSWVALGEGFNGTVYAVERFGGGISARTYAAGAFTHTSSGGTQLNRIARFTGNPATWQPVGTGVGFNGPVYALRSSGGYLYASGNFTSVDGIPCLNVARWNGSTWQTVDGGAGGAVNALAPYQNELVAGGQFTSVKAATLLSPALARLLQSGLPWIAQQPNSQTCEQGQSATLSLVVPTGYATTTYQWQKDGVPVTDGPSGSGSTLAGATTESLSVTAATLSDVGVYDCVLTNACGSLTSNPATLTVNTPVAVDLPEAPVPLALAVSPNPSRGAARLHFSLPTSGPVRIEVFDVQGRRVAVPLDGWEAAGFGDVLWSGKLPDGGRAAAGVYFARMVAGGRSAIQRITLLP